MKLGNSCKSRLFRYAVCWMVAVQLGVANAQQAAALPFSTQRTNVARGVPVQSPKSKVQDLKQGTTPTLNRAWTSKAKSSDPKLLGGLLETVSELLAVLPLWKTVGEGETLTLSIGVDVLSLVTLQWYFNGEPLVGETQGTLIIPSVTADRVGHYQLRATLLGITLLSVPTDVQINKTDDTVDHDVAAFDSLSDAHALLDKTSSTKTGTAKSGTTSHGYSGTQIFNTLRATKDLDEPDHCGISGGKSEWFAWQCPTNGTAIIHTDGSSFDTVLAVYIGPGDSYTTLTNVACDNNSGADGRTSRVTFTATPGTIYYIAVDGVNGASGTVKLNFIVGTPPAITGQPASRTVALGAIATLRVNALGFPAPRYQWLFNGAAIPDATNNALVLNSIAPEHLGQYSVRVTNTFDGLLSTAAHLFLEAPLHFTSQRALSNGFHLTLLGPAGTNYLVESTTNFTDWIPLATNRSQTGLLDYLDTRPVTSRECQFYRARPVP